MNLEEKSTANICQEENPNNALLKILPEARSEEFLSPTRRSSRIRKPKISTDYCTIDEAIENTTDSRIKEQAKEKLKQPVTTATNGEVTFINCDKGNELSSRKGLEKSSQFFQVDSDEEESFESMFDDIFGQRYSKTLQSLLPKKLKSESIKERKFFKRNCQDSPKPSFSEGYSNNKSNLPTEDVDKVFKIISKPNILSDMPSDSKSSSKPPLKIYCNKRKNFQKSTVVESFGLPDYPIIPENVIKPILNDKLDAEILDASEITLLDIQFSSEPWVVTNIEGESFFPFYEEVRSKAEPVKHERVRKNSSFIDPNFIDNSDICNDFNICTSTSQIAVNDKLDEFNCMSFGNTPRTPKTVSKTKEIDIEAIKVNFKKMLNRKVHDISLSEEQTKEEVKVKVKRNISLKKNTTSDFKRSNFSVNNEISFLESDSLTIENKEFEISNISPVPKKYENKCSNVRKCKNNSSKLISSSHCNKTACEYTNSPSDTLVTEDSKIIREQLKPSSISDPSKVEQKSINENVVKEDIKVHHSSRQKTKVLKSSGCKNEISVEKKEVDKTDIKLGTSPKKKTRETDFVLFKSKEQQSENQKKIAEYNEGNEKLIPVKLHESSNSDNKKRLLRSSLNNSHNLQSLKANNLNENANASEKSELINTNDNSGLNHNCTKEELLLNSIIKTQSEKLEILKRSLKSNINVPSEPNLIEALPETNNKQIDIEKKITSSPNEIATRKRLLRSASQENLAKKIQEKTKLEDGHGCRVKNASRNNTNEEIKTDVKVNLEKLTFEIDFESTTLQENEQANANIQETATAAHKNDTNKDKKTKSVKSILKNDKSETQLPEIGLHTCNVDFNFPSNYNESLEKSEDKMLSPLKKDKKSVPEIRIIISPLNVSLLGKVPETITDSFSKMENMSPTKRKLRSTQAIIASMNIEKKSITEPGKERMKSPSRNKTLIKSIDSEIKISGIDKENSTKQKEVLNNVETKPIDDIVLENNKSELNSLDQFLNEDIKTDVNSTNELNTEQIISHNEEYMFQKNLPKIKTPRKNKGTNAVSSDVHKKIMNSYISVNKFYPNKSLSKDSNKELEEYNFINSKIKENSDCNERCDIVKNVQKQTSMKTNNTEYIKSNNIELDHSSKNIDNKKSSHQEFNSNKSQIKNMNVSSKSTKLLNNLKTDLPKESTLKISTENGNLDEMKQSHETTKHSTLIGNGQKNDEQLEDMFTTETHNNLVDLKSIEKQSKTCEKEDTLDQLRIETAAKNEKLKACITSNKLVTIKINPSTANNYLTEKDEEKVQLKTVNSIRKELIEEGMKPTVLNGETMKLNNVCLDVEVDLLKNIADNKKVFDKIISNKSNAPAINDLTTEGVKLRSNRSTKGPSSEINVTDAELGVDNNTVDKVEIGQSIKNCLTISQSENKKIYLSCDLVTSIAESIQESEEDCLEIAEIFSKVATENKERSINSSLRQNNLAINEVSTSTSSIEINVGNKKTKKLTGLVANTPAKNPEVSSVSENFRINVENSNNEKTTRLLSIKSKESKQLKEKSPTKAKNEIILSPKLREKKLKSISSQTNSSLLEKSPRKSENNRVNKETSTETPTEGNPLAEYLKQDANISLKNIIGDITSNRISRRSDFNRKSDDAENILSKKGTQTIDDKFKSGRSSVRKRRKSISDIDLLDTEKEQYKDRLRRSKSVVPSALGLKKKINDRDYSKVLRKRVGTCDDSVKVDSEIEEVGNRSRLRSKSFSYGTLQSRNRNVDKGSVFTENLKKYKEKLVDKKEPKEIKGKISQEGKEKTKSEKAMANKDIDLDVNKDINFQVGDLAWGQIGSHPFWPCLVVEDPETRSHIKRIIFQGKRNQRILYHVRFFGDNGRRAWINKHQMMLYSNSNDLKALSDRIKFENKSSTLLRAFYIRPNKLKKWECAVDEAEHLKLKNVHEKVSFFTDMFASKAEKKQKHLLSDANEFTSEPSTVKRKRKETDIKYEEKLELSSSTDSTNERSPVRKRFKKEISAGTTVGNENLTNLPKRDNEVVNVSQNENTESSATQNENVLSSRLRLRKQIDEISEIDSKTSSDNTVDITLYSMAFQKALFKRNNLFKGVSRDKVCQYCCEPKEVLKCKGRCNGSYHTECATKMLQEKLDKKKRAKNISSLLQDHENKKIDASKDIKEEKIIEHPKTDKSKSELLEDDHVQIITVPSSMYNTPPRKTFPPNFKNMTLAEQIDYKMKEIMKKFESKTFYAESFTDSSSEENSLIQPLSKIKKFSRCGALFPNSSSFDKESKTNLNEEKNMQVLQENKVVKNEPASDGPSTSGVIEKWREYKDVNNKSKKKSKCSNKQKRFVAHVTADSDSLESSKTDIQEDNLNVTGSTDTTKSLKIKNFKCGFCISDLDPFCFICNQAISKRGSCIRQKCSLYQCGRFYHPHCLKMWPQTQWSLIQTTKHKDSDEAVDSFVCPLHVCHTCASDDPRAATSRCSSDKIVKCLRCPSTYHSTNLCVPAGTTILSSTQIICPRHRETGKLYTINTTWCFLCSEGGNLVCCETCPTSVHPECLPVNLTDDDKFICEDCESGRLPLYDEIVWVKLGKFRWWPALILFPNEVPDNIMNIKHDTGEFVVKFFGTYDHYWVNRGRSFLFQEGDTGHCNSTKSKVDAAFNKAVEEAVVAHKAKKEFKLSQEAESITSLKPPPYIRIKVNKPVGNVRQMDLDLSSTNACECNPSQPNPCGPDSDCLNRLLLTECSPDVCPAGQRCKNQSFDKREYPPLVPYKTQGRGWGLKTLAPIKKGQFVIEYVGEMIDIEEYQRRIQKMHEQKEENYYFLTIDKDRMLDAGPKGNVARFMNHCCQPNCETQKWTVNGDTRVGLFATEDISADTELTFNYNLECVGKEKKVCRCGAPNCSGFIGVKAKQDTDSKKPKKSYKKKKPEEPIILPPCFICGKKGKVGVCNNKVCNNAYHLKCLKMTEWPEGNKFICPWHNCNICSKRTIRCCVKCVNSFCPSHSEGNVRYDNLLGFVCNDHDPMEAPKDDEPVKLKKKKSHIITDESAVTSTTTDEFEEEDLDLLPLILRKSKSKKKRKEVSVDSESENDFEVEKSISSTPKRTVYSDHDSQDESTVSSATATDVEESTIVKRKRGRPKREDQTKKKRKVNNVENHESTASSSLKDDNSLRNSSNCELSSSDNELENR